MGIHGNFARSPLRPQETSPTNSEDEEGGEAAANQGVNEDNINGNLNRRRYKGGSFPH